MDSLFEELVAVDSKAALEFFVKGLIKVHEAKRRNENELVYVASVLAHYSQTSTMDSGCMPSMANLSGVFDTFILPAGGITDAEILEIGGSQILLFAGFFRSQMRRRHNVEWYDAVGQSMYERASHYSSNPKRRELFDGMAESFPMWTTICEEFSGICHDSRLIVRIN